MKEEWKTIPESDDHAISNYGRMKKLSTGLILKPQIRKKHTDKDCDSLVYVIHNKSINNKKHLLRRAVSVCVVRAFRPEEYIEGKPIYRVDGDINNNRVDNFRYEDKAAKCALRKRTDFFNSLISNDNWTITGDISDTRNKVMVKHNVCGNTYTEKVSTIYRNKTPYCLHCKAVTANNLRRGKLGAELNRNSIGRFEIFGKLGRMDEPISIMDNKYSKTFTIQARKFLRKGSTYKSPYDLNSESVGESMVEYMLMKQGVSYFWQFYFNDCRNIKPLPFDFAVMNGDTVAYVVEYQGGQHYKNIKAFSQDLEERKHIDDIKASYCKKKGIPLLLLQGTNYISMNERIKEYNHKYVRGGVR